MRRTVLFTILCGLSFVACDESHYNAVTAFTKAIDACIRTGGIPITGMWNTLERCDAPPNCVEPTPFGRTR